MHWVLFDYGNVISLPQPDQDVSALAEAAGCPPAVFANGYWTYRLDYDRAALDATTYWQKIAASAGLTFSSDQIASLNRLDIQSWLHLNSQTVQLVDDLAAAGHPLAMLSNAPAVVARAVAELPLVTDRFRRCFFSCDFRSAKPDPEIFHAVLAGLDARPGEVTFLDDRADNVAGAAAVGIRAIHFTDAGLARAELARLGITAEPGALRPGHEIPRVSAPGVGIDAEVLPAAPAAQVPGGETADQAAGLGVPRQVAEPGLGGPDAAPPEAAQPNGEEPGLG